MIIQKHSSPPCIKPLESIVQLLGRQWTVPLILFLGEQADSSRYSEIRKKLCEEPRDIISDSTLSRKLTELTNLGIIDRKSYDEVPPRVEYRLTNVGMSLFHTLEQLAKWTREQCHSGTLRVPKGNT